MQWDIKIGREQEFSEFIVREFAPRLMKLGIEPTDILYTLYGEGLQMYTSVVVDSREQLAEILRGDSWKKLHGRLLHYITNYSQKIVTDTGRFQI
ncbi:hypothetical protein KFU94_49830 [Chloroflexi bacterium TSY]|nr:hypothetical protein [Chloroflexi bacterium TSY]